MRKKQILPMILNRFMTVIKMNTNSEAKIAYFQAYSGLGGAYHSMQIKYFRQLQDKGRRKFIYD